MKRIFTHVMFCILFICACCSTTSAQKPARVKTQFPFCPDKNTFKKEDTKAGLHREKLLLNNLKGASVNSLVRILDSIYSWNWDTITGNWKSDPYNKAINFVYDANNYLLSLEYQVWNGISWTNSSQTFYTYDLNHNRINYLYKDWNGTSWDNNSQTILTYDANNNLLSRSEQIWNGTSWDNQWQSIYTYDANNNQLSTVYQGWNGSSWYTTNQVLNTYDFNNNKIYALHQTWSGTWTDDSRDSLFYDVNNNNTYTLIQNWVGNAWDDESQSFYNYDVNNNVVHYLHKHWTGSLWENVYQDTITYDANNNYLSDLLQSWDGFNWTNMIYSSSTVDANNFYVSDMYQFFDNAGVYITDGDSSYYYFHTLPSSVAYNAATADDQITLYPNPVQQDELQASGAMLEKLRDVEIFDAQGRLLIKKVLAEKEIQGHLRLDVSNLNTGIYVAAFNRPESSSRLRFIINK